MLSIFGFLIIHLKRDNGIVQNYKTQNEYIQVCIECEMKEIERAKRICSKI